MRRLMLGVALIAFGAAGCGKDDNKPVQMTPEMEAEQRQAQQTVNKSERERQKSQKPEKTHEQNVEDAERNRPR
jgi:hypothetical protein